MTSWSDSHVMSPGMTQCFPAARQAVVVLGMHRSGTSLCAHLLHALGVDMASEPGASPSNAGGHWERPRLNDLNDQIFGFFDRAWSGPSHILAMPEHWMGDPRVQAVKRALAAILADGLARAGVYGFKDPRTARLLPLWRQVFAELGAAPRFVVCIRDPAQVSRSVSARDKMAREHAEYRWLIYNADIVAHLGGSEICLVPYEHWFTQPVATMRRVADFVGLPAPRDDLAATIVDAGLRHDDHEAPPAGRMAQRLYRMILDGVTDRGGHQVFDTDLRNFCALIGEFEQQMQPLLVDREILRASVADQNRVIGDLNAAIRDLRRRAA
jgi:hypothetical protein